MEWKPSKSSAQTIHAQIVEWFIARITSGDFPLGMKCPSQRKLATQFGVNRSTINTAMEELKANGYLQTRVGSGTFIAQNPWSNMQLQPNWQQHIQASIHKPNLETIQLINDYEKLPHMIRLGTGELAPHLLPIEQLQQTLADITLTSQALGYSEPQGSYVLRKNVCQHLQKRGIHTTPDNVLIISGALQAFQLIALGLLERGSVVFQQKASYLNSIHPFQSAGMQMYGVTIDDELMKTLQHMKRTRNGLFSAIPTLDNPTGRIWTEEEKQTVYDACRKLAIPILEDDVYGELLFERSESKPLKAIDEAAHVLYVSSMSKTVSPGLRIGWIVGPTAVIRRLADIKMQTDYGSSAISQEIVTHWLSSGMYEQMLNKLRAELKRRAHVMETLLTQYFHDIATWTSPKGGFYIWLRFQQPIMTKPLFHAMLEQNIIIHPGYIYMPNDYHHLRMSFAYASDEQMTCGIQQLANTIEQLRT